MHAVSYDANRKEMAMRLLNNFLKIFACKNEHCCVALFGTKAALATRIAHRSNYVDLQRCAHPGRMVGGSGAHNSMYNEEIRKIKKKEIKKKLASFLL
jgi:hypothetical protein